MGAGVSVDNATDFASLRGEYERLSAAGVDERDILSAMKAELSKVTAQARSGPAKQRKRGRNLFQPGTRMSALRRGKDDMVAPVDRVEKDVATTAMLRSALQSTLFEAGESQAIQAVLDAMEKRTYASGADIIKQGETGKNFCVVASGAVDVVIDGKTVKTMESGSHFGELSLIYEEPVSATIKASGDVVLWLLGSTTYRHIQHVTASRSISQRAQWLRDVPLLKPLSKQLLSRVAHSLEENNFGDGDTIVKQGDSGDTFFIIQQGEVLVYQNNARRQSIDASAAGGGIEQAAESKAGLGKQVDTMAAGSHFGEMALMKAAPRNASCVAKGGVRCLTMRGVDFKAIMGDLEQIMEQHNFELSLRKLDAFKELQPSALRSMVRQLTEVTFAAGEVIAKAGDVATGVHIVKAGTLTCNGLDMDTGATFGEGSLSAGAGEGEPFDVVAASAGATCMLLSASTTRAELGLGGGSGGEELTMCSGPMSKIPLEDLTFVALLGEGSFGRVTMVKATNPETQDTEVLALKRMCKQHIIDDGQQDHIKSERDILAGIRPHPFLLHLYATYQDADCVYLLTNVLAGGELFTVIHPIDGDTCLPLRSARFYAANVFLAIEHLHRSDVIYRDMKPENVLVSNDGYLCVIDMGFAKRVPFVDPDDGTEHDLTYTMCGTPEYMAPEFILQTGHNSAVDYWALGVLVYEMLFGVTPFLPEDEDMGELFKNIARVRTRKPKGRARPPNVAFPEGYKAQQPDAVGLINQLLDGDPAHRLGMMQNGTHDIRNHPFFSSMDWSAMLAKKLPAPFKPQLADKFDASAFEGEESGELDLVKLVDTETNVFLDF